MCGHYLVKNLVVDYVSKNGRIQKLIINKEQKKLSVISLEKYRSELISENNKKKCFLKTMSGQVIIAARNIRKN